MDYTSISFHQTSYRDIVHDGKLNGIGRAEDSLSEVDLGMGLTVFDEATYRTKLAQKLISVAADSNVNKTGVTLEEVQEEAEKLIQRSAGVFEEVAPVSIDSNGPDVTLTSHKTAEYVSGEIELTYLVEDETAVEAFKIIINGSEFIATNASEPALSIDTSLFSDGVTTISVETTDIMGNTTIQSDELYFVNSAPFVNRTSATRVNNSEYLYQSEIASAGQSIDQITINGEIALIDVDIASLTVLLSEGINELEIELLDGTGKWYTYTDYIELDSISPIFDIHLPHQESLYQVFYLNEEGEGSLKAFTSLSSEDATLFVTNSTKTLGDTALTENNLQNLNIPYISILGSDGDSPLSTAPEDLTLTYTYLRDGEAILVNQPVNQLPDLAGTFLVPLTEEALGANWYVQEDGTIHQINLELKDALGNSTTIADQFSFTAQYKTPSLDEELDFEDTVTGDLEFDFSNVDLGNMKEIKYTIDGVDHYAADPENPTESFDTSEMSDGLHTATITMTDELNNVYTKTIEFTVDNTAPVITVTSDLLVNNANYSLTGSALDAISTTASVQVDATEVDTLNLLDGSFSHSLILNSGANPYVISATDSQENGASQPVNILLDDLFPEFSQTETPDTLYRDTDGNAAKKALDFSDSNKVLFMTDSRAIALDAINDKIKLVEHNIPFLNFTVLDPDTTPSSNAKTLPEDIQVTMTYSVDGTELVSNQVLNQIAPGEYLIPLTSEYLGDDWHKQADTTIHEIKFSINDIAGNTTVQAFEFKASDEALPLSVADLATNWIRGTVDIDFGDITPWVITDTEVTIEGVSQIVENKTTTPTTSIDSNVLADGNHTLVATMTNRLSEQQSDTVVIKVDNTAPTISLSTSALTGQNYAEVSGTITDGAGSGVNTITANAQNVKSDWNATSKAFQSNINLVEGPNALTFNVSDIAGSTSSLVLNVDYDATAPVYTDTRNTSYKVYFNNSGSKQLTTMAYDSTQWWYEVSQLSNSSNDVSTLESNKVPYVAFSVSDAKVNGVGTNPTDLITKFTYLRNGSPVISDQVISPKSTNTSSASFVFALTEANLGSEFWAHGADITHSLLFTVTDQVGRTANSGYLNFKVYPEAPAMSASDTGIDAIPTFNNRKALDSKSTEVARYTLTNTSSEAIKIKATNIGGNSTIGYNYDTSNSFIDIRSKDVLVNSTNEYVKTAISIQIREKAYVCSEHDNISDPIIRTEYWNGSSWVAQSSVTGNWNATSRIAGTTVPSTITGSTQNNTGTLGNSVNNNYLMVNAFNNDSNAPLRWSLDEPLASSNEGINVNSFGLPVSYLNHELFSTGSITKYWHRRVNDSAAQRKEALDLAYSLPKPVGYEGIALNPNYPGGSIVSGTIYQLRDGMSTTQDGAYMYPSGTGINYTTGRRYNISVYLNAEGHFIRERDDGEAIYGTTMHSKRYITKSGKVLKADLSADLNRYYDEVDFPVNLTAGNESIFMKGTDATDCLNTANNRTLTSRIDRIFEKVGSTIYEADPHAANYSASSTSIVITDNSGNALPMQNGYYVVAAGQSFQVRKSVTFPSTGSKRDTSCSTVTATTNCDRDVTFTINRQVKLDWLVNAANGTESTYHKRSVTLGSNVVRALTR